MEGVRDWRIPKASKETIVRETNNTETRVEAVPDVVLDAIANLSQRVAALEERNTAIVEHYIAQEKSVQAILQALADNGQMINFILDNGVAIDGAKTLRKAG